MPNQFQNFYKMLTVKILFMICLVILPIIALIMGITNLMIDNLQEKLIESYKNGLALGMTRVDAQVTVIEEDIMRILSENWVRLNLGKKSDTVDIEKFQFFGELKTFRSNLDMVAISYLKTNWDNAVSVTYNSSTCSYEETEKVKEYLANNDLTMSKQDYQLIVIGSSEYLVRNIGKSNFSFGFILKVDDIISVMKGNQTFGKGNFYLATKKGEITQSKGNIMINLNKPTQNVRLNGINSNTLIISYPSSKIDYTFVRLIPVKEFNSELPFLQKLLKSIAFLSIIIIPIIYLVIQRLVLVPLSGLNKAMRQIENENLDYRIEKKARTEEFQHIFKVFNRMADRIKQLTIDSYEKDIEKLQIEANNLRLQVNPHMLLNSLNMIYSLSQSKNYTCIQEFTLSLVDYFRYSLHQNEKLVKLSNETKYVNSYLEIQKIRFPDTFTYVFDIEEELFEELVPPLLIQNFVENSIKYALKIGSEIEILVIVKKVEEKIIISVCDTGNGIDEDILEKLRMNEPFENKNGKHIGIWNCRRRLKMYYGDDATINISSKINEGTQVWIQIPISNKGEK